VQITVGIPAYNEEKNIAKLIVQLRKTVDNIIVCNDGSTDLTGEIAEKMGVIVLNHPRNLGYGAGIRSLFLKAKENNADILVTFDADGQHRVDDIQKVVEPILNGEADIVIGSRFLENEDSVPELRKLGINTITKIANITTKQKVTDSQSGFRAYSKKAIQEIVPSDYGMGVSTEILIKADKKNMRIVEVPIKILYDGDTSTHNPVGHGASVILSTMKFISIERPLKFYGGIGLGFIAIGVFFIVWALQIYSESKQIITNITLIGFGSSLIGVMLIMTAILLYTLVSLVREHHS
jgi:glycosyltransferase involved in cell wall biosynthesis